MLFSVVDDRSGVAYQEYRCVYGEDVEADLRFLFNAMALVAKLPRANSKAAWVSFPKCASLANPWFEPTYPSIKEPSKLSR